MCACVYSCTPIARCTHTLLALPRPAVSVCDNKVSYWSASVNAVTRSPPSTHAASGLYEFESRTGCRYFCIILARRESPREIQ